MTNNDKKIKVELIKEIDQWGRILYSIERDGFYVSGSCISGGNMTDSDEVLAEHKQQAEIKYNEYISKAVYEKTKTIIQTTEI